MTQSNDNTTQAAGLSQLALWSAANLAGMINDRLAQREPFFRRLMKKIGPTARSAFARVKRPSNCESLPLLANAVVGSSRSTIFAVFGPPGGVAVEKAIADGVNSAVWDAGTWYYPLPQNGAIAMAINFEEDHARYVEFFEMPR